MPDQITLTPLGAAYLVALDAGEVPAADDEAQDVREYDAWLAEMLAAQVELDVFLEARP